MSSSFELSTHTTPSYTLDGLWYTPWMNVDTTGYGSEFTEFYGHGLKTHRHMTFHVVFSDKAVEGVLIFSVFSVL